MFKSHTLQNVDNLRPLIDEYILDLGMQDMTTTDYIITNMSATLQMGNGRLMSDDPENPTSMIWATVGKSVLIDKTLLMTSIVYIKKNKRGNSDLVKDLMSSLELVGQFSGCDKIYGGDWKLSESESAAEMWKKSEYNEQESFFVKELN